ncbi:hypothetical protein [Paraburkholderia rhynchosiae]|uniref:Uncharacterized protein n=1 Tax=Paraburkholderia rhynchosiae TaxID=487049 RepID=A0A2N7WD33_9BURK|nr:hypothetical protein [Paraburkholderia rhynchosiae]PMS27312.1 hypothetical protein C0Z16_25130 [Paraburkholderia rhynchosiae]CAB3744310.1 hypothetical protein LMG27174_07154 [Paraburkholderia rhynchosiae]
MKKHIGDPKRTVFVNDGELCEPGPEDIAARTVIFNAYRTEIDKRHLSNAESFDKAILTYANAGLGLSITIFKEALTRTDFTGRLLLQSSWGGFTLSILLVIASFLLSQRALFDQIALAERYLLRFDEKCNRPSGWQRLSDGVTLCAAAAFCLGVIGTVSFALFAARTH